MIVTPHFVFIHMHKSGGTFVNELLARFYPEAREIGYHLPLRVLPAPFRHLPVLGFVRNPFSYYVSWYSFQKGKAEPNALFRRVSNNGELSFGDTLRNLMALATDDALLDAVLAEQPEDFQGHGMNLPRRYLEAIRGTGVGFYSFLFSHMFGAPAKPLIGRNEFLREDLRTFLNHIKAPMSPDMEHYLDTAERRNVSEHDDYRLYYDDALRALVEERDAAVLQRFGYRFDMADAPVEA